MVRVGDLPIGLWYPTTGTPRPTTLLGTTLLRVAWEGPVDGPGLPLVVVSHGNGGGPGSHADLAMALAGAGYVVAAPVHRGDNTDTSDGLARAALWSSRNADVVATIEHVVGVWGRDGKIDSGRVGAFGFSAGGFTVLTAVGAQPELAAIAPHCAAHPEFVCTVLQASGSPLLAAGGAAGASVFVHDPRIRAAVLAAPGLGFTLAGGLDAVQVPIQLWAGALDDRAPAATNAEAVRAALPTPPEYHAVANAGHLSFLAPCRLLRPPALCADAPSFDRSAFHADMNAQIVRFFDRHLR